MKIIFLLPTTLLTLSITSDSHSLDCSKTFLAQDIQITCKRVTDGQSTEAKFVIKLKQDSELTTPESDCTTTNCTITCQQLIALEDLGIGQHKLFAILYLTSGQVYSYSAEVPITLDFPNIALKNCDYDERNKITVHCMCERTDVSEIETRIYMYINDVEQYITGGNSLKITSVISGSTVLRCVAENVAGWRSNTASVYYNLPSEESIYDTNNAGMALAVLIVIASALYYIYHLKQELKSRSLKESEKQTDGGQTLIDCIKECPERTYRGLPLTGLLQCLVKFARTNASEEMISKQLETFLRILAYNDPEEQEFTTEFLKESTHSENFYKAIMSNDELIHVMSSLPKTQAIVVSEEFPKKFVIQSEALDSGAFGSVHLVKNVKRPAETKFVAKKLLINRGDEINEDVFNNEAMILLKVKHPRIVQFHGYLRTGSEYCIFMEYVPNGTLSAYIARKGYLDEDLTRYFTIQILEGVDYLHKNNIIHGDIKGNNILMVDDANIKITDFGISAVIDGKGVPTERGTVRYMAPEVIATEGNILYNYTCRADIWSVGCTAVEMNLGRPPYSSLNTPYVIFTRATTEEFKYTLPDSASANFRNFLNKIFQREPKDRPSADELLRNDPFIKGN